MYESSTRDRWHWFSQYLSGFSGFSCLFGVFVVKLSFIVRTIPHSLIFRSDLENLLKDNTVYETPELALGFTVFCVGHHG